MSKVFIISVHVSAAENSIMPPNLGGAYVSCYSKGANYVDATENVLKKLVADGLHPEEILQPIHEMELGAWSVHVGEKWPRYVDSLPSQIDFENLVNSGEVVYGPFGTYNPQ